MRSSPPGRETIAATSRPSRIGNSRIVRLVGEGGMGAVYQAEQDRPRRTVALKVIRPGQQVVPPRLAVERMVREQGLEP